MSTDPFPTINPDILHNRSVMVPYKVKDGDSIQSIAESVGLTWKELAVLNWGTDVPEQINWYLVHYVGCTKKAGEHNYAFSSTDEPGIVWLPYPIPTQETRVRRGVIFVSRYPIDKKQ